jgi:hypothetical protein
MPDLMETKFCVISITRPSHHFLPFFSSQLNPRFSQVHERDRFLICGPTVHFMPFVTYISVLPTHYLIWGPTVYFMPFFTNISVLPTQTSDLGAHQSLYAICYLYFSFAQALFDLGAHCSLYAIFKIWVGGAIELYKINRRIRSHLIIITLLVKKEYLLF